jgi:Holliday junction resolvase RusA-like endonuclease
MTKRHFFLAIDPPTKTQQEHRIGKRKDGSMYFYEGRDLKEARNKLKHALAPHAPEEPETGPIRLLVKWCFPAGSHKPGSYKTTRPDTDNLNKMLKDEMTKLGFWKDDALVTSEIIEKFWSDVVGIYIEIERLEDD